MHQLLTTPFYDLVLLILTLRGQERGAVIPEITGFEGQDQYDSYESPSQ